ncbi:MAG: hypothetical protein M1837_000764 [Sclerophora amabilis]|nr:MAG: hypothetical protein M1837_000764 [Sclerophora amabilis]
MLDSSVMTRLFDTLSTRPLTPPKETIPVETRSSVLDLPTDAAHSSPDAVLCRRPPTLHTPQTSSPLSSAESGSQASGDARKKVGFSACNKYLHAPTFSNARWRDSEEQHLKPLPPSRERTSSKSILKPYLGPIPLLTTQSFNKQGNSIPPNTFNNFAEMLESLVQQLAGQVRSSRIDAYVTFASTLKAYDDVPDPQAIKEKIDLLVQFIRRDMSATMPESGALDTLLATHALKLLAIFVWTPEISRHFPEDFKGFVLDHAIASIGDVETPKALVNHYMHILGLQKFGQKAMTIDRANRLLSTLVGIEGHVKGNGIIAERLVVYQKILGQARPIMIVRAGEWLNHLFSGLLSTIKEIRSRAITFGIQAGLDIGGVGQVSRNVKEVFKRQTPQGLFAEYIEKRLITMVARKEDGPHAAQIWSVVILFLRSRPHQLEHWEHMKPWLLIIQKCFNSGDVAIKFQANIAWNRLIFAINPNENTSLMMVRMLKQPIIGQLERKVADKSSKPSRKIAISSLCSLLYYSLRPSATAPQLDLYWEEYVNGIVGRCLLQNAAEADLGCQILASFFDGSCSKGWSENRANEVGAIKPEELPRIDVKWVRCNTKVIIDTISVALSKNVWNSELTGATPIERLWEGFTKSIAEAGNKEIKVSTELMEAVAQILNLLQRSWRTGATALGVSTSDSGSQFLDRFGFLLSSALKNLGPLCFTSSIPLQYEEGIFEVAKVTTHNGPRDVSKSANVPAVRIFQLLSENPQGIVMDETFEDTVKNFLQRCCSSRSPSALQNELLHDCALAIRHTRTLFSSRLWQISANLILPITSATERVTPSRNGGKVDQDCRLLLEVLTCGCSSNDQQHLLTWASLLQSVVDLVRRISGENAVATAVVEPLAATLRVNVSHADPVSSLAYVTYLLRHTVFPRISPPTQAGPKKMWKDPIIDQGAANSGDFSKLGHLTGNILESCYSVFPRLDTDCFELLSLLDGLISRCPKPLLTNLLKRIQLGLGFWTEDSKHKLSGKTEIVVQARQGVVKLWTTICRAIASLPSHDSGTLGDLEPIICSGLSSSRQSILNEAIAMWNSTFGAEEALEYPPKVQIVLQRLKPLVELRLPTFPESRQDENLMPELHFSDSQDEGDGGDGHFESPFTKLAERRRIVSKTPQNNAQATRSRPSTPRQRVNVTPKRTRSAPRLRHDNSQIQFMAIESSPLDASNLESQILTVHQREVKERQQAEAAAMFPDLRSTPRSKQRRSNANRPQLTLSSGLPASERMVVDAPATPMLVPPSLGPMDDFVASSPTPRQGTRESIRRNIDTAIHSPSPSFDAQGMMDQYADPPSSPPQAVEKATENERRSNVLEQAPLQESPLTNIQLRPPYLGNEKDFQKFLGCSSSHDENTAADIAPSYDENNLVKPLEDDEDTSGFRRALPDFGAGIPVPLNHDVGDSIQDDTLVENDIPVAWDAGETVQETLDETRETQECKQTPNRENFVDALSSPRLSSIQKDERADFDDALQSSATRSEPLPAEMAAEAPDFHSPTPPTPKSQTIVSRIISPFRDRGARIGFWPRLGRLQQRFSRSRGRTPSSDDADKAVEDKVNTLPELDLTSKSVIPQTGKRKRGSVSDESLAKRANIQEQEDRMKIVHDSGNDIPDCIIVSAQSSEPEFTEPVDKPESPIIISEDQTVSNVAPISSRLRERRRGTKQTPPLPINDDIVKSSKKRPAPEVVSLDDKGQDGAISDRELISRQLVSEIGPLTTTLSGHEKDQICSPKVKRRRSSRLNRVSEADHEVQISERQPNSRAKKVPASTTQCSKGESISAKISDNNLAETSDVIEIAHVEQNDTVEEGGLDRDSPSCEERDQGSASDESPTIVGPSHDVEIAHSEQKEGVEEASLDREVQSSDESFQESASDEDPATTEDFVDQVTVSSIPQADSACSEAQPFQQSQDELENDGEDLLGLTEQEGDTAPSHGETESLIAPAVPAIATFAPLDLKNPGDQQPSSSTSHVTRYGTSEAPRQDPACQDPSLDMSTEDQGPTGPRILSGLQRILDEVQGTSLRSQEVRDMDNILFNIRREIFRAEQNQH